MAKILITAPVESGAYQQFLSQGHEVTIQPLEADWDFSLHQAEAWVTMVSDFIPEDKLQVATSLKIIANHAVGINNIPLKAAGKAGIAVSNTPDVLTQTTAELALALLLSLSRRVLEGHALVSSGQWQGWEPTQLLGQGLYGKTVGIIGAGRIGQAFGQLIQGFQPQLLYFNRSAKPEFEASSGARKTSLESLLKESDFISLHLPSSPETRHLLYKDNLALMKPSALLINTGRGDAIDEEALVTALKNKELAGVALDVFEHEPQVTEALKEMPNVVLCPHIGSATTETRRAMALMCLANIEAVLTGKIAPQVVQ